MVDIKKTWFYTTALQNYTELQEIFINEDLQAKKEVGSYFLSGNTGVGKTTEAILEARKWVIRTSERIQGWHYTFEPDYVTYVDFRRLLNDREFGNEESKTKAFYRLQELEQSKMLIFDDIRAESLSNYHKTQLDTALLDFLSRKYANRNEQFLVFTSNNTKDEISKCYSQAVCSRLFGICEYISITGEDRRIKNQ